MSKFQVGDRVKIEAVVKSITPYTIALETKSVANWVFRDSDMLLEDVELVERPKKKVKAWKAYFIENKNRFVSSKFYQSKEHFINKNSRALAFLMLLDAEGCEFEMQDEIEEGGK